MAQLATESHQAVGDKFVSDVVWPEGVVEVPVRTLGIGCSYRPPRLQGRALIVSLFRSSFAADFICLTSPADWTFLAVMAQRAQRQELGKRRFSLECAAAQVCREAGARVASNVFVRDMDLFDAFDGCRLEIVADGLTLLRGAQLATGGTVRPGRLQLITMVRWRWRDGGRKETICPEFPGEVGRARLVVFGCEGGSQSLHRRGRFQSFSAGRPVEDSGGCKRS